MGFFKWLFGKAETNTTEKTVTEINTIEEKLQPYENEADMQKDFAEEDVLKPPCDTVQKMNEEKVDEVLTVVEDVPAQPEEPVDADIYNLKGTLRDIYKRYNGEIPKNHLVVAKDGNRENKYPCNLEAISRQEHYKRTLGKQNKS